MRVEHLHRAWLKAVRPEHRVSRLRWDLRKHRTPAGQAHAAGMRQVKCVVPDVEKQTEDIGAADDRDDAV